MHNSLALSIERLMDEEFFWWLFRATCLTVGRKTAPISLVGHADFQPGEEKKGNSDACTANHSWDQAAAAWLAAADFVPYEGEPLTFGCPRNERVFKTIFRGPAEVCLAASWASCHRQRRNLRQKMKERSEA
eukprot:s11_g25.t1